jgi:hypothetical protein
MSKRPALTLELFMRWSESFVRAVGAFDPVSLKRPSAVRIERIAVKALGVTRQTKCRQPLNIGLRGAFALLQASFLFL